jgi:hypothetical protein
MKRFAHKRGSVLMEFIIVIPIYIVLLAGLFMIGDSFMKGTQLAHEERLLAFNNETGDGITRNIFHADVGVLGPWTLRADIKKEGAYLLPEYGIAGMLLFGDQTSFRGKKEKGAMRTLMDGGSIPIYSKDNDKDRQFRNNVYMLRRNRDIGDGELSIRDNRRHSSDLLCAVVGRGGFPAESWSRHVADEKWHDKAINDDVEQKNGKGFPKDQGIAYYTRHGGFMKLLGEEN